MANSVSNDEPKPSWTINGRFLSQRITGVQRYAREIVAALDDMILAQRGDFAGQFTLQMVVPPRLETEPAFSNIAICGTQFGSGYAWEQFVLPFYIGTGILSLGNSSPLLARNSIVCIHDANVFIQPESYSRTFGLVYRNFLPLIGRRAKRVATVSQFSADMLVKYGVCSTEKIFIAPNGHEHALRWNADLAQIPQRGVFKRPYVLLLGSRAKHKNVEVILEQAQGLDAAGIDIVVVGGNSGIFAATAFDFRRSNVHEMGYVNDDDLAALYAGATCLIFPSKTEGFGIPVLEAMARGCPVISSKAPSLVEVGGDASIYVDADNGNGWREAIIGLSSRKSLRAAMVEKGRARATLFSWKRSAEIYLEEIQHIRRHC